MRPRRLAGMAGIGVDRVGDLADALADPSILRFENLDTDLRPHPLVVDTTRRALTEDRNNSYLPFVGQTRLREAAEIGRAHV